ncbi:uncharacterized protein LOC141858439 [Brevipalpus obovatus]|uniref:uncharacterized protein LOC141858439 n=1 Tax=Brevipalpus obovatus TaxID=246614 RepID=UPI003D9DCE7F
MIFSCYRHAPGRSFGVLLSCSLCSYYNSYVILFTLFANSITSCYGLPNINPTTSSITVNSTDIHLKDAKLVIYSIGPCLVLKRLLSDQITLVDEHILQFEGSRCNKTSHKWISAIDYTINRDGRLNLFWTDTTSSTIFTGILDAQNASLRKIMPIIQLNSPKKLIRSISIDKQRNILYLTMPLTGRLVAYDIGNLKLIPSLVVAENGTEKISKILWSESHQKLFWFSDKENFCFISFSQENLSLHSIHCRNMSLEYITHHSVDLPENKMEAKYDPKHKVTLQTFTIDPYTDDAYLFYSNGMMVNVNERKMYSISPSYKNQVRNMYSVSTLKCETGQCLNFYISDVNQRTFRLESFKLNQPMDGDHLRYELDKANSRLMFVDMPSIYDFIIIDPNQWSDENLAHTGRKFAVNSSSSSGNESLSDQEAGSSFDDEQMGAQNMNFLVSVSILDFRRSSSSNSEASRNFPMWPELYFIIFLIICAIIAVVIENHRIKQNRVAKLRKFYRIVDITNTT